MPERTKLGELLVEAGLIDELQLAAALGEQARWGNRLGETLVQLGYLTEAELVRTLSRTYGIPGVDLEGKQIEPEVLALLAAEVAEEYHCIPLFKKPVSGGEVLYLGMAHPEDLRIIDDVSFRAGLPVRPVVVGPVQLNSAIAAFYRGEGPRPIEGDESAADLAEAPVPDGDTAPVFSDLQEIVSESLGEVEVRGGERGRRCGDWRRRRGTDLSASPLDREATRGTHPRHPPCPHAGSDREGRGKPRRAAGARRHQQEALRTLTAVLSAPSPRDPARRAG